MDGRDPRQGCDCATGLAERGPDPDIGRVRLQHNGASTVKKIPGFFSPESASARNQLARRDFLLSTMAVISASGWIHVQLRNAPPGADREEYREEYREAGREIVIKDGWVLLLGDLA